LSSSDWIVQLSFIWTISETVIYHRHISIVVLLEKTFSNR
jgi:hypothetical protein